MIARAKDDICGAGRVTLQEGAFRVVSPTAVGRVNVTPPSAARAHTALGGAVGCSGPSCENHETVAPSSGISLRLASWDMLGAY